MSRLKLKAIDQPVIAITGAAGGSGLATGQFVKATFSTMTSEHLIA